MATELTRNRHWLIPALKWAGITVATVFIVPVLFLEIFSTNQAYAVLLKICWILVLLGLASTIVGLLLERPDESSNGEDRI